MYIIMLQLLLSSEQILATDTLLPLLLITLVVLGIVNQQLTTMNLVQVPRLQIG